MKTLIAIIAMLIAGPVAAQSGTPTPINENSVGFEDLTFWNAKKTPGLPASFDYTVHAAGGLKLQAKTTVSAPAQNCPSGAAGCTALLLPITATACVGACSNNKNQACSSNTPCLPGFCDRPKAEVIQWHVLSLEWPSPDGPSTGQLQVPIRCLPFIPLQ